MKARDNLIIPCPALEIRRIHRMSRFYSESYKWSLYEKYQSGFTLTEICEISGVTDKPLREWFRYFDLQHSKADSMILKEINRRSTQLSKQLEKTRAEVKLLQSELVLAEIPEHAKLHHVKSSVFPFLTYSLYSYNYQPVY